MTPSPTREIELPELPQEHTRIGQVLEQRSFETDGSKLLSRIDYSYPVFTDDQMREYAKQAVLMERERCAAVCDRIAYELMTKQRPNGAAGAKYCATAIREG